MPGRHRKHETFLFMADSKFIHILFIEIHTHILSIHRIEVCIVIHCFVISSFTFILFFYLIVLLVSLLLIMLHKIYLKLINFISLLATAFFLFRIAHFSKNDLQFDSFLVIQSISWDKVFP